MDPNNSSKKGNKKQTKRRETNPNPQTSIVDNPPNQPVNIAIRNEHPLLIPFILETVLIYCKGHQPFASLRLVCKLWDTEVCKILRPRTQIPLYRLLNPYPEGLSWKWNRSHKSTGYQYQSPYPDTPEFENIKVTVTTCKVTKDPKVIRWFEVMGGQVKSLHYSCALNCYHQNVFLGYCLQSWCPNLTTLHLSEIQCFASLIYIFEGRQQKEREFEKEGLNCKNLRSLIISVDSVHPLGDFDRCSGKKSYYILSIRRRDIFAVYSGLDDFKKLINSLPERDSESDTPFYQLIEKTIEDLPANFFETIIVPKYFDNNNDFKRRKIDWGVIGLILRAAPLKKIVVKKLDGQQQCKDLALFLLYQPSTLKSTLEHLEFQDNVFIGRDASCLKTLSLFKCPLKYLRLDNLMPKMDAMGYLNDLLESCAGTLETLEINIAQYTTDLPLEIPPKIVRLPNLKKFVHRNVGTLAVIGNRLWNKYPKLEICKFFVHDNRNNGSHFFGMAVKLFLAQLETLADHGHPLKDLEFGGSLHFLNIEQLVKGLGNLVKVDLELGGQNELEYLLESMGNGKGKMEDFRVVITGTDCAREEKWSEIFSKHLRKIKGLKFLEIVFQMDELCLSLDAFTNGFAKMEGLTSLKVRNFRIWESDKEVIETSVEHVPFIWLECKVIRLQDCIIR